VLANSIRLNTNIARERFIAGPSRMTVIVANSRYRKLRRRDGQKSGAGT